MSTNRTTPIIRRARISDRNHLRAMQVDSMRKLAIHCYSRQEIEAFIAYVGTMDDQLIEEGTYSLVEIDGRPVASGGWSRMRGNYVGTPPVEPTAAKIRSVFVRHEWARHGFGRALMERTEREVAAAGFDRVELNALLSGVPFYRALGYEPVRPIALSLPDGIVFRGVTMVKRLDMEALSADADRASSSAPLLAAVPAVLAGCVGIAACVTGCAA